MKPEEIAKFLAEETEPGRDVVREIGSRRYNVYVKQDGKVVETFEYLTLRQARETRAYFRANRGLFSDIIEDVTTDRNGKEIVFHPNEVVPFVCGRTQFRTPEVTPNKIRRDQIRIASKKSRSKVSNQMPIRYTEGWRDPKSPNYKLFIQALKRQGYLVRDRFTGRCLIIDFQKEIVAFLSEAFKAGWKKEDFEIKFLGGSK